MNVLAHDSNNLGCNEAANSITFYRSTTTSHRYISFSGIPNVNVMKPDASSYWNSISVLSTAILLGLTDEYAPNAPQPRTFMHTAPVPSASYFTSVIAPPELNILIRPIGANADPDDVFLTGTTVKTSYSFAFNVTGKDAFLGR